MDARRDEFLAGERPDDVHVYLHEDAVSNLDALEAYGDRVDDGIVLVLDGSEARSVFQRATGIDPMGFAKEAMQTDGDISDDCTDGSCPDCGASPRFVFAFAEAQNEEVGGMYADGNVIHGYASCTCGTKYSEKWLAAEA